MPLVSIYTGGIGSELNRWFQKASAVAKLSNDRPLIDLSGNVSCMNVDRLSEDVLNAIRKLARRIESGECDDLAERINCRLDILAKEDFEELNKLY